MNISPDKSIASLESINTENPGFYFDSERYLLD